MNDKPLMAFCSGLGEMAASARWKQGARPQVDGAIVGSVWREGECLSLEEHLSEVVVDVWDCGEVYCWEEGGGFSASLTSGNLFGQFLVKKRLHPSQPGTATKVSDFPTDFRPRMFLDRRHTSPQKLQTF